MWLGQCMLKSGLLPHDRIPDKPNEVIFLYGSLYEFRWIVFPLHIIIVVITVQRGEIFVSKFFRYIEELA